MSRRILIIIAVVAGVGMWSLTANPDSESDGKDRGLIDPPMVGVTTANSPASSMDSRPVVRPQRLPAESIDTVGDVSPPSRSMEEETFVLRVVDGDTGRALTNAPVQYLPKEKWSYPLVEYWYDVDWLNRHADVYHTRATGEVTLPAFEHQARVTVVDGDRRGDLTLRKPTVGTPLLRVEDSLWLDVQIVNPQGEPVADVPLSLKAPPRWATCGNVLDSVLWTGHTGDQGIARIGPVATLLRHYVQRSSSGAGNGRPYVQIGIVAGIVSKQFWLDPWRLPDGVWQISIPATGSLTLQMFGPDARELEALATISACPIADESSWSSRENRVTRSTQEGGVTLPLVAVGKNVRIFATTEDGLRGSLEVEALNYEGEQRTEVMTLSRPALGGRVVLTGRLCVPESRRSDVMLESRLDPEEPADRPSYQRWKELQVDSDGSFTTAVQPWQQPSVLRIRSTNGGLAGNDRPVLQADVVLPAAAEAGIEDVPVNLGKVELQGTPLLVAGQVVDEQGSPIKSALIRMTRRHRSTLVARAGDDGRFAVFAEADFVRSPYLRASASGYYGRPTKSDNADNPVTDCIRFEVGQSDLTVVLRKRSVICGRLILDRDIPPEVVTLRGRSESGSVEVERGTNGQFQLGVVPGPVKLTLGLDHGSWRTEEFLTSVEVDPAKDHEILEIDLRGKVQRTILMVVDQDGQPQEARVGWAGNRGRPSYHCPSGVVTLYTQWPFEQRATVLPAGGRYLEVELDSGRQTVVTRPGIPVKFHLTGRPVVLDGWTLGLYCRATPASGDSQNFGLWALNFRSNPIDIADGPSLVNRVHVPEPGWYQVGWIIRQGSGFARQLETKAEFEIVDETGPEVIELAPPPDREIRAAAQR